MLDGCYFWNTVQVKWFRVITICDCITVGWPLSQRLSVLELVHQTRKEKSEDVVAFLDYRLDLPPTLAVNRCHNGARLSVMSRKSGISLSGNPTRMRLNRLILNIKINISKKIGTQFLYPRRVLVGLHAGNAPISTFRAWILETLSDCNFCTPICLGSPPRKRNKYFQYWKYSSKNQLNIWFIYKIHVEIRLSW